MADTRASQFAAILRPALAVCGLICLLAPGPAQARNSLVIAIPDLSETGRTALAEAKIKDTRRLYQRTRKGGAAKAAVAGATGLSAGEVDRLAAVADLCRLYKVTPRVAHLMNLAGVSSIQALGRQPNAEHLLNEITRINMSRRVTENLPTAREVAGWIKDAKVLKPEDWEQTRKWASIR